MMRKRSIGYRITAGLIVTALLTAGLSILLFYNLTDRAFNEYTKENRIQMGWESAVSWEHLCSRGVGRCQDID